MKTFKERILSEINSKRTNLDNYKRDYNIIYNVNSYVAFFNFTDKDLKLNKLKQLTQQDRIDIINILGSYKKVEITQIVNDKVDGWNIYWLINPNYNYMLRMYNPNYLIELYPHALDNKIVSYTLINHKWLLITHNNKPEGILIKVEL